MSQAAASLLLLVCTIVMAPFISHEGLRFYTAYRTCAMKWTQNELLANNTMCRDAYVMHSHGDKQVEACARAKSENLIGPVACGWKAMWIEGYGHRVASTVTESPWMIFGLASVALSVLIVTMFKTCRSSNTSSSSPEVVQLLIEALSNNRRDEPHVRQLAYEAPVPKRRYIKLIDQRDRLSMY
jgi:hypothetical protein